MTIQPTKTRTPTFPVSGTGDYAAHDLNPVMRGNRRTYEAARIYRVYRGETEHKFNVVNVNLLSLFLVQMTGLSRLID